MKSCFISFLIGICVSTCYFIFAETNGYKYSASYFADTKGKSDTVTVRDTVVIHDSVPVNHVLPCKNVFVSTIDSVKIDTISTVINGKVLDSKLQITFTGNF